MQHEFVLADRPAHPIVLLRDEEYLVVATTVHRAHEGPTPVSSDVVVARHYVVQANVRGAGRFLPTGFRLWLLRKLYKQGAIKGPRTEGVAREWVPGDLR